MRPLRLLFYTHALSGGGAERVWVLLASGLKRRGHDVRFAVDYEETANAGYLDPAIPVSVLGRNHALASWRLSSLLRGMKADAAFAAVGASNLKLAAAKMLGFWRGAAIFSFHGRIEAEHGLLGRLGFRALPMLAPAARRIVTASDDLRTYLITRFAAPAAKTVTVHNAILLPGPEAVPSAETLRARSNHVLAMGRLVAEKDFATLIEAVAGLAPDTVLTILGEGPERTRLEHLAAAKGLGGRIVMPGYLADPSPAFGKAKLLALSSTTEAFGNVLIEAMGHGLPVVATRCGGPEEILGNGAHGRLTAPGDAAALRDAIAATLADPGDPAAHRSHAETFSVDLALDRVEALLQEAAG